MRNQHERVDVTNFSILKSKYNTSDGNIVWTTMDNIEQRSNSN